MTDSFERPVGSGRKTPGQLAYEADCALQPNYDDRDGHQAGIPRKTWDQLSAIARDSWERDPTVRARPPGPLDTTEPRG
ncbi:hypothetical protein [Bradyrhizobium sp. SZCCHNRI2049]|uniref:hypothetical protein n=1 Tax=Bradyrhizobium sp. SZCCHNRI2049 TaxID=3057287 RepID=UPI0029164674|nr:hypothetical protein [Bradyrhizobium sp. SZCCHNRI2049]